MRDTWTAEKTASLAEMWAAGHSASQIATELELPSRSAVIGKVRRMGLPEPLKKLAWSHRVTQVRAKQIKLPPRPTSDLSDAALHIEMIDLEPHHCRFPYGDGPFTFCGHAKLEGASYCSEHVALTRQSVTHQSLSAEERERRKVQSLANLELHRRKQARGLVPA